MSKYQNIVALANKLESEKFSLFLKKGRGDCFLLILFQSKAQFSYDGKKYFIIPKDTAVLFSPYNLNAYKAYNGELLNSFLSFKTSIDFFNGFDFSMNIPFKISSDDMKILVKKIDRISFLINTDYEESSIEIIESYIKGVFTVLNEAYNNYKIHLQSTESNVVKFSRIRQELYDNPIENTVKIMAKKAGYTETYFGILYKKIFGINPVNDRQSVIANMIKELLETTNYSLATITEKCQMSSIPQVTAIFKKYFNMTPHQYRLSKQKGR